MERIKAIGRWFVRRDAEASGTRMGGWIGKLEIILPTIVGVSSGILSGIALLIVLWMLKAFVGYVDLNHLHVHAYGMHYISEKAPANVIVINNDRRNHRAN